MCKPPRSILYPNLPTATVSVVILINLSVVVLVSGKQVAQCQQSSV